MTTQGLFQERYQALSRKVRNWERRRRFQQSVLWLPRALLLGLVIGLVVAVGSRLQPWLLPDQIIRISMIAVIVSVAGMLIVMWAYPRTSLQAAQRFDVLLGLDERVSTAFELIQGQINSTDEFTQRQIDDAYARTQDVRAGQMLPLVFHWREWLGAAVLAAVLTALILLPNPQSDVVLANDEQQAAIDEAADDLREIMEEVAADPNLTDEDRESLLEEIETGIDALSQEGITPEEAFAALTDVEAALEEQANELQAEANAAEEAAEAAAEAMREALNSGSPQSGQSGMEALQNELEQLEQNLDEMSQEQQNQAAQGLNNAAQELQQTNPEAAQGLNNAAQQLQQGNPQGAQGSLQQSQESLQQGQQNAQGQGQSSQQLQEGANQAGESAGEIGEAWQQIQPGQQGQGGQGQQGQQGQQGAQGGQGGDEGENGEDGQGGGQGGGEEGEEGEEGQGGGAGAGDGEGGAGSDVFGSGGQQQGPIDQDNNPDGEGESDMPLIYAPRQLDVEPGDDEIQLAPDGSAMPFNQGELAPNPAGENLVPLDDVVGDYTESANRALDNDYIPLGMRDVVREYFSSLDPTSQQPEGE